MKLTVKELKALLADMDDDALVFGRNRDCINLEMVHVVKHPTMTQEKNGRDGARTDGSFDWHIGWLRFVPSINKVYGGEDCTLNNKSGQCIIFCDGD